MLSKLIIYQDTCVTNLFVSIIHVSQKSNNNNNNNNKVLV